MEKDVNATREGNKVRANQSVPDASFFDTKEQFEIWLDTLKPSQPAGSTGSRISAEEQTADFFVECGEGTNCQIEFTGVLDIGGFLSGSLWSNRGTLVTRAPGKINADIDVAGRAFIDSEVNGNINATGRVVLKSNAKVLGDINAPALSIKRGAIFEGDCVYPEILGNDVDGANTEASEAIGFSSSIALAE